MAQNVVIANPIINSPFAESSRHFFFDEEGITDRIVESRRRSRVFRADCAAQEGKDKQLTFDDWTADRIEETGAGNLFMVFGEPDLAVTGAKDGQIMVEIRGVDVYDHTTGEIRSSAPPTSPAGYWTPTTTAKAPSGNRSPRRFWDRFLMRPPVE